MTRKTITTMSFCAMAAVMFATSIMAVADESMSQTAIDRWGGFHVGVTAGQTNAKQSVATSPRGTLITAPYYGSRNWGNRIALESDDRTIGGIVVGYDWLLNDEFLLGLEADLQQGSLTGNRRVSFSPIGSQAPTTVTNATSYSLQGLSTLRGRVGYRVQPDLLLYATAGLAYGRQKAGLSSTVQAPGATLWEYFPVSLSQERFGYALGIGGDWALGPNWSARLGYQHISLGKKTSTAPTTYLGLSALPTDILAVSTCNLRIDQFQLGITYKF